ncbi:MAG: hypothetical protein HYZ27_05455 [Deltaproteobacteria bacterium]|nr:hypothetical protein [Deltaproteobacteria bacterium]
MSGRDLLYKPPVPLPVQEEQSGAKPADKAKRVRDLGGVPADTARSRVSTDHTRAAAYKAAYFNKDISGVHQANPRAKPMQALRGSEGALDLKKVVLPPAMGGETPNPDQLRAAGDLMGLGQGLEASFAGLLGRQKGWLLGKGVTVEMIKARLAQLADMIEARRAALKRMLGRRSASATLDQAESAGGAALDKVEDVAGEGSELVRKVSEEAQGMHRRLAKMLGIKQG